MDDVRGFRGRGRKETWTTLGGSGDEGEGDRDVHVTRQLHNNPVTNHQLRVQSQIQGRDCYPKLCLMVIHHAFTFTGLLLLSW